MQAPSNRISLIVHHLLEYISVVKVKTRREIISEAIKLYRSLYGRDPFSYHKTTPQQNPLIYPQPFKYVLLTEEDRTYLGAFPTQCSKKAPEALDRVIITYQNHAPGLDIPEHLKVNWMDNKYLNWMEFCP